MRQQRELDRQQEVAKYDRQSFEKIWSLIRPYRGLMTFSALALTLFNIIGLTTPWMLKIAIDQVLPNADYVLFWVLSVAMIIIFLARSMLRYVACYLVDYTGVRMLVDLRQKVFKHLQSLSLRFYEEYRTGKLLSSVINDVGLLQGLIATISRCTDQIFQLLIISGLLLVLNWRMGLVVLCTLPLHYFNFTHFRKVMRKDSLVIQEKISEISANLSETLSGVRVVKSFSKERTESLGFFQTMRPIIDMQMRLTVSGVGLGNVLDMLILLTNLAVIGIGMWCVHDDSITLGEFVAFYTYVGMLMSPINVLSGFSTTIAHGMAGGSRIVRLLNTIPEIKESPNPVRPQNIRGDIEFKNVVFSYEKGKEPTIKNFNLSIKAGQKIALVGASGSGKSTISNLLLRFYDVDSGSIKVDGIDIRRLELEAYRNHTGVVLQEPFLFSGSIRDNIGYAKRDATEEEIEHAAEMANVTEFVEHLDHGFNTVVGENGASLSGGQKQRLAIARAVLKNPSILILDEATSALDTVSEFLVQEALDRLMQDKTTIIIAHRLSTVKNADVIVVLDHGVVVQQGTHDDLMAQPGIYRELYQSQRKLARQA